MPKHVREALALVNDEVTSKYYGCGLVAPELLENAHILDLGSGSGQDCFVLSKLVGQNGHVTGLDMTDEQLEVARNNIQHHTDVFGYTKPNVTFVKGYIEKLKEAGLEDSTFDIIISNCVVNLSPDKRAVLSEAYRVLKDGGELYFSDVYADRELSEDIRKDKVLWGECISGALYWKALVDMAAEIGFSRPCLVSSYMMTIGNAELEKVVGDAKFTSSVYRLFKIPKEKSQPGSVIYEGEILGCKDKFEFDHKTCFKTGDPVFVNAEIATILKSSRFEKEFTFEPSTKSGNDCSKQQSEEDIDPFILAAADGKPGGCGGAAKTSGCC